MSRPAQPQPPGALPRDGNLDEVGAVLCAIVSLTSCEGDLEEEDVRAIYALACIALNQWRLLDGMALRAGPGR